MRTRRLGALLGMLLAGTALFAAGTSFAQQGSVHGINPADMDFAADPRADFYRFANGGWLDRTAIPADQPEYGVFNEVDDRTTRQLLVLLGRLGASQTLQPGTDEWKAVQFYRQGTDLAARNRQGIAPIRPTLDAINALTDLESLHRFQQTAIFKGIGGLFSVDVFADLSDSRVNAAYLGGPFLGLPNRDYYIDDDEAVRTAYIATISKLLVLAGHDASRAPADAAAVYAFEQALAEPTLSREEQQDIASLYNPTSIDQLSALYPLMDWQAYLRALGLANTSELVVTELPYLKALAAIIRSTPISTVRAYLTFELVWNARSVLTEEIERTAFDFRGKVLFGVDEQRPLPERVLDEVNSTLGEALGRLYVAEYFPPEAKAQIEALVTEIITAFGQRLEQNTWMSPETKAAAQVKLARIRVKVGYPDRWRSYAAVELGDSYAATSLNGFLVEQRRRYAQIDEPVDKEEWDIPPQVVNAYYDPLANAITFPAGILQAPFFDYQADPASNYGAIGFVIGHEITHGFDLQGSQFDGDGNLAEWWSPEDVARFTALNRRVAAQYGAIELLPGVRVNGQTTVTENVADLGGLQVAYDALRNALGGKASEPRPVATFDMLTQEQRFFIAASSAWRAKTRDEFLLTQVRVDEHSPALVRATQPLRNMDAFHAAFGIQPGDRMYLSPEERVVIW